MSGAEVCALQASLDHVEIDERLQEYIIALAAQTRTSKRLELGVSPRGTLALQRAAKASALLEGRTYCVPDDIKPLALPVLAHRVMAFAESYGEASAPDTEAIMRDIIAAVPVPL